METTTTTTFKANQRVDFFKKCESNAHLDADGNQYEVYADVIREWRQARHGVVTKPKPNWKKKAAASSSATPAPNPKPAYCWKAKTPRCSNNGAKKLADPSLPKSVNNGTR